MIRLPDFPILDFSGGVRNDKSDFTKNNNEFVSVLNYTIDDSGALVKRRGSHQYGDTASNNIQSSFLWERSLAASGTPTLVLLIANSETTAGVWRIIGSRLRTAIAAGATSIPMVVITNFDNAADSTAEIEGDIITYQSTTGGGTPTLNTATNVTSAHVIDTAVHQIDALTGTGPNGEDGLYYASLNNVLMINGRAGSSVTTINGTSMSAIADADEPAGLFATVYRQRCYVAGDGTTDASGTRNGDRIRVAFSEPGDLTDWGDNTVNFFDVEGTKGDQLTGLRVSLVDTLLIFKIDSIFSFDRFALRELSEQVGAYNHYVVKEVNGLIYTFCPSGIWVTNGLTFQLISEPIQKYIEGFVPIYASANRRTIINTFAASFENKYILYLQDVNTVTGADGGAITDVMLVYDTIKNSWTIWNGVTNFQHINGLPTFKFENQKQNFEGFFGGDNGGKFYRFFSKKFVDSSSPNAGHFFDTGDLTLDLVSSVTSLSNVTVKAELTTKLFDMDTPQWIKTFKYVRALASSPGMQLEFQVEGKNGLSEWLPIGEVVQTNQRFRLPNTARGYRIAFRIADAVRDNVTLLNGLIVEDITADTKT